LRERYRISAVAGGMRVMEYAKTMAKAAAGIVGVTTVIPGHGAVATWQAFVEAVAAMRGGRSLSHSP